MKNTLEIKRNFLIPFDCFLFCLCHLFFSYFFSSRPPFLFLSSFVIHFPSNFHTPFPAWMSVPHTRYFTFQDTTHFSTLTRVRSLLFPFSSLAHLLLAFHFLFFFLFLFLFSFLVFYYCFSSFSFPCTSSSCFPPRMLSLHSCSPLTLLRRRSSPCPPPIFSSPLFLLPTSSFFLPSVHQPLMNVLPRFLLHS